MDVLLVNALKVIYAVLNLYWFIIIVNVIASWLVAFNVINTSNRFVYMVMDFTYRLTEPLYRRIRSILPDLGGIDLSPIIVLLAVFFLQGIVQDWIYRL